MKSLKKIKPRLLLIGAGNFGQHHARVLAGFLKKQRLSFFGIVERNPEVRKRLTREYGVPVYEKLTKELLQTVDAVDIVTPAASHFALVKECLNYVHVLVEKPLTLSSREAKILEQKAQKTKRFLMVGHIYRFHPFTSALKKIIAESKTSLKHLEATFVDFVPHPTTDCGVLFSDLHAFDILDDLLGQMPITAFAVSDARKISGVEKNTSVLLTYPQGVTATVRLSWEQVPKTRQLRLFFSDKIITADFQNNRIITSTVKNDKKLHIPVKQTPLETELSIWLDCLENKSAPMVNSTLAGRIIKIVEKIQQSAQKGQVIKF